MLKLCHFSTWALLSLQLLPTSANGHAHEATTVHKRDGFAFAVKMPPASKADLAKRADLVDVTAPHKRAVPGKHTAKRVDSSRGRLPIIFGGGGAKIGPHVTIGTPGLRDVPLYIMMGDPDSIVYVKGLNTTRADYNPTRSSSVVKLQGEWGHDIGLYGKYYTDLFTLGDLPAVRQNFIGLVSTDGNRSLDDWHDSSGFGGHIGLGLRDDEPVVGNTFMEGLFKAGAISKKLFALQVSIDSFIQFGAINHSAYVDHLLWSPVLTHVGGWAVQADGFVVNNKVVPNTGGPLQFETASAYTTIPERIASKLFAHIDHKLLESDSDVGFFAFKCDLPSKVTVGYSIKGRMYSIPLNLMVNSADKTAEYPAYCNSMFVQVANESPNSSMISARFMQMFYGIFDSEHDDGKSAVGLALAAGW